MRHIWTGNQPNYQPNYQAAYVFPYVEPRTKTTKIQETKLTELNLEMWNPSNESLAAPRWWKSLLDESQSEPVRNYKSFPDIEVTRFRNSKVLYIMFWVLVVVQPFLMLTPFARIVVDLRGSNVKRSLSLIGFGLGGRWKRYSGGENDFRALTKDPSIEGNDISEVFGKMFRRGNFIQGFKTCRKTFEQSEYQLPLTQMILAFCKAARRIGGWIILGLLAVVASFVILLILVKKLNKSEEVDEIRKYNYALLVTSCLTLLCCSQTVYNSNVDGLVGIKVYAERTIGITMPLTSTLLTILTLIMSIRLDNTKTNY